MGFDNYMNLDILITKIRPDKDMRAALDVTKDRK